MLSTMAQLTGCGGGGWSDAAVATQLHYKAEIAWDGQPVFFQDFVSDSDTSFLRTGYLESNAFLRSKGEKRIGLINEIVNSFESRFPTYKLPIDIRPTLLLDEVDNHLGLAAQSFFWNDLIGALSKKYQLILATHSIFPILLRRDSSLRKDQVIVMIEDYDRVCMRELSKAIDYYNKVNGSPPAPKSPAI